MTDKEIAQVVDEERLRLGLTIDEVLERSGLSEYSYLKAKRAGNMHYQSINALAEAVGLEIVVRKKEERQ